MNQPLREACTLLKFDIRADQINKARVNVVIDHTMSDNAKGELADLLLYALADHYECLAEEIEVTV